MIPVSHVLAFAAVAAVLIAVPGPSVLFTVSRAVTVGRRAALVTVVGNEAGLTVQVVAVAFGAGTLVQRSAEVFTAVKLAGAAYLIYLGVQAIRHRRSMAEALAGRAAPVSSARALRDGFLVGVANPKTIVFLTIALPAFTVSGHGSLPVPVQMIILGLLFPVIALVLDSLWAVAAGTAREWFARSPRRLDAIGSTAGLVLIGLGVSVAATGRSE
jgi:threonine/homoserine/homoserine lactone efflux protein